MTTTPPHEYVPDGPVETAPYLGFRPPEVRQEAFGAFVGQPRAAGVRAGVGGGRGTPGQAVDQPKRFQQMAHKVRNGGSARFLHRGLVMLGERLADDRSSQRERARPWLARRAGI